MHDHDKYIQKKSRTTKLLWLSRTTNLPDAGHEKMRNFKFRPGSGNNILAAGPPREMTLEKRADDNPVYTPLSRRPM